MQSLTMTITIKQSFKFGKKIRNLSGKFFDKSTTFGIDFCWYEHAKHKISPFESTPVGAKTPDPKTLTLPTESSKRK